MIAFQDFGVWLGDPGVVTPITFGTSEAPGNVCVRVVANQQLIRAGRNMLLFPTLYSLTILRRPPPPHSPRQTAHARTGTCANPHQGGSAGRQRRCVA